MAQTVWVVWRLAPSGCGALDVRIVGVFDSEVSAHHAYSSWCDHITEVVMNEVTEWCSGLVIDAGRQAVRRESSMEAES